MKNAVEIRRQPSADGKTKFICEAYGKTGEFEDVMDAVKFADECEENYRRQNGGKEKT